jgi:hypothetical protein
LFLRDNEVIESRPLKGKWRIVEMAQWDADDLDLVEPAYIEFDGKGFGTFVFGCLTASLHGDDSSDDIEFTWDGSDEGDQVSGDGWAELQPDGSLDGEISFRNGDESTFKARPW